jgi:HAD superfamily hydrolase (TIGR01509 family)
LARTKGILFDIGGTLLDFINVDARRLFYDGALQAYEYVRGLGQPVPDFRIYHRGQFVAVHWHYAWSRLTGWEFNALDVLGRLSRGMGQQLTPAQLEELAWRWYEPLGRCATCEPGLAQMLEDFRRQGLRLGLVSKTFIPGTVLDRHLAREGLLGFFDTRIYSCDVRYRKPHRRIFHIALEGIGCTPQETVFVGDRLRADIFGANRVGMTSVLKDPTGRLRSRRARPDHRILALTELGQLVRAMA